MSRAEAEAKIAEIPYPQDSKAGQLATPIDTFGEFIEVVYLPVYRRKWIPSTAVTEENQIRANLVPELGPILIKLVTRGALHSAALPTGDSARPIPE